MSIAYPKFKIGQRVNRSTSGKDYFPNFTQGVIKRMDVVFNRLMHIVEFKINQETFVADFYESELTNGKGPNKPATKRAISHSKYKRKMYDPRNITQ